MRFRWIAALCMGIILLLVYVFVFSGFVFSASQNISVIPIDEIQQRVRLTEISLGITNSHDGIVVKQSYLELPNGKVLLETYPVTYEPIDGVVFPSAGEIAEPFFQKNNQWYAGFQKGMVQTSFNCGTFAVGDFIGLKPTHVLDGVHRPGYGNPLQIVLDNFFKCIEIIPVGSEFETSTVEHHSGLLANDVICFVETRSPVRMFVHAGRIVQKDGRNFVVSKIGRRGPIMLTNLQALLKIYPCTEIQIFRIRVDDT